MPLDEIPAAFLISRLTESLLKISQVHPHHAARIQESLAHFFTRLSHLLTLQDTQRLSTIYFPAFIAFSSAYSSPSSSMKASLTNAHITSPGLMNLLDLLDRATTLLAPTLAETLSKAMQECRQGVPNLVRTTHTPVFMNLLAHTAPLLTNAYLSIVETHLLSLIPSTLPKGVPSSNTWDTLFSHSPSSSSSLTVSTEDNRALRGFFVLAKSLASKFLPTEIDQGSHSPLHPVSLLTISHALRIMACTSGLLDQMDPSVLDMCHGALKAALIHTVTTSTSTSTITSSSTSTSLAFPSSAYLLIRRALQAMGLTCRAFEGERKEGLELLRNIFTHPITSHSYPDCPRLREHYTPIIMAYASACHQVDVSLPSRQHALFFLRMPLFLLISFFPPLSFSLPSSLPISSTRPSLVKSTL